ncbi:uncharacterized protein KGF55_005534, partial [Candida pseudojiufengensis]|uniref:uncharacterized protein n=1 Tax=Candida pseudojiufengensis TaxID=497109 RepID=UPI002224E022
MFLKVLILFITVIFQHVFGAQVSGIFTNFNSLTYTPTVGYTHAAPNNPTWQATLDWTLDGTRLSAGDTFQLMMPCVFKFITDQTSVDLTAQGVSYATCQLRPGELIVAYSTLDCTVKPALSTNKAYGSLTIPLTFNVGGSGNSVDMEDASCFDGAGQNTVTFRDGPNQLSIVVNFDIPDVTSTTLGYDAVRIIPTLNKQQIYALPHSCPKGYSSGTLGLSAKGAQTFDCSNWHFGFSNTMNDWYFPRDFTTKYMTTQSCTPTLVTFSFKDVPAGYKPFIDSFYNAVNGQDVTFDLISQVYCTGSSIYWDDSKPQSFYKYNQSLAFADGHVVVVTTKTVTGTAPTSITTLPFNPTVDKTQTIQVIAPVPTVTVTKSHVGLSTSYSTVTNSPGGTATYFIDNPYHLTTTSSLFYSGNTKSTSTFINPSGTLDTVFIYYPVNPTTTVSSYWSNSYTSTSTATNGPGKTDSLVIQYPNNPTVTSSIFWTGVSTSFSTTKLSAGSSDTIVIAYPSNPTRTTTIYTGSSLTTTTQKNGPGSVDSVIVNFPVNPTSTKTQYYSGSTTLTSTITATIGGTDSVIVNYPSNSILTKTQYYSGSTIFTSTATATFGGQDSVIVNYPSNPTTTKTQYYSGSTVFTSTATATFGGQDSVIVNYPSNPTLTKTQYYSGSTIFTSTATATFGGQDSVIVNYPSNPTLTKTQYYSGSTIFTSTATATFGGQDSVIVNYPSNPT